MKIANNCIEKTLEFLSQNSATSSSVFFKKTAQFLSNLFKAEYVVIDKYNLKQPHIAEAIIFYNKGTFKRNKTYFLENTPCYNVIDKKTCSYKNNVKNLFPKDKFLQINNIESYVGVPLWKQKGSPIGLINVMSAKPIENTSIIEQVLQIIALKVEKILEKEEYELTIKSKIKDLIIAKKSAEDKETKFQAFTSQAADGYAIINEKGDFLFVNKSFTKMTGYSKKELQNTSITQLNLPKKLLAKYRNFKNDKVSKTVEMQLKRKDNSLFYAEITCKTIVDEMDKSIHIIIRDIDENVKITKDLLYREEKYKKFSELAQEAIIIHQNGIAIDVNLAFQKLFGYSKSEIIGVNAIDLIATKDSKKVIQKKAKLAVATSYEAIGFKKDGTKIPVEIEARLIDKKNNIRVALIRDLTQRKQNEIENEKLSIAVEQSSNSIVITDAKGLIEYVNPKFTEVTGYTQKEVLGKNPRVLKSGNQTTKFYKNLWKTISSGKTWKGEFHNKTKKGKLIWEHAIISPIRNVEGKIINYLGIKEDITNKIESEEKLKNAYTKLENNKNYLSNILKTANEGFWIVDDKTITIDVNAKLCELLGYSSDYIIGRSIFEFVDKKNIQIFKNQIALREKGIASTYEIELQTAKGKNINCLFKTSPIFNAQGEHDGSFALVTDITAFKETQKKLEKRNLELHKLSEELAEKNVALVESQKKYKSLFEQSPISIWEVDFSKMIKLLQTKNLDIKQLKNYIESDNDFFNEIVNNINVVKINRRTKELFGISSINELASHLLKDNKTNLLNTLKNMLSAILSGERDISFETSFINTENIKISAIIKAEIKENDSAIVSVINITSLKNAKLKLEEAKEKAEESNKLKTEFINNMSHEIRTPMNGILGFSELLNNPELSSSKRQYYTNIIQNSGKQLLHVIDDILEISRLGTKQVKFNKEEVNLNELMFELFSIFDIKAKENKTPLYLKNGLSEKESFIYSDKAKLFKVLSNLLENALKFTNKGYINFGYNLVDNNLEIYVEDSGIGIHKEKQLVIFERFAQGGADNKRNTSGLGLGLSIAKENTEIIGGKITVQSQLGKGSKFIISIPYTPVFKPKKVAAFKENVKPNSNSKNGILIVEDEEINYLFIEILLREKLEVTCDIYHAKDGQEAIEMCKRYPFLQLVLMDINMPVLNGYKATKVIKKLNPNLPIIAQTAYATFNDKQKALESGFDGYISKPILKRDLQQILSKYFKNVLI